MWIYQVFYFCIYFSLVFSSEQISDIPKMQDNNIFTADNQIMWHAYKFKSGIGNREELVVNSIKSDDNFDIGQDVTEWQSLKIHNISYIVGLMESGFTISTAVLNNHKSSFLLANTKVIDLQKNPKIYTLHKIWNYQDKKYDIFIIVAFWEDTSYIHWYRITPQNDVEKIWQWHLLDKVVYLKIFETDHQSRLLIINANSDQTTADIYDFILGDVKPKFRLLQTIFLDCPTKSTAINKIGSDIFLSIPQNTTNLVRIFHLIENRFVPFKNISSKNVNFVSNFNIGYRSFLAIGGYNFGIYRFSSIGLIKEEIIDLNFEEVTYFLPVPVDTYRDEVMLLVQHHIDYHSHVAPHVKVLLYAKETFVAHDEIPCTVYGQFTHGATCLADEEFETGIYGSAVISLDQVLGVVVPRFQVHSGLFLFDWKLMKLTNPLINQIDYLLKKQMEVDQLIKSQQGVKEEIIYALGKSLKVNEPLEITLPWKINSIIAPKIRIENTVHSDSDENFSAMEKKFETLSNEIDLFETNIKSSRSTRQISSIYSKKYLFENLTVTSDIVIKGKTNIEKLFIEELNGFNFDELKLKYARKNTTNKISGTTTFLYATINELTTDSINEIPVEDFAYKSSEPIRIKGDLIFENYLMVNENVDLISDGTVNNILLKDELVYMNSNTTYEDLLCEFIYATSVSGLRYINEEKMKVFVEENYYGGLSVEIDTLDISNIDIFAKNINREEFASFLSNIYLKNLNYNITGNTKINGKVVVHNLAETTTLNDLKYPEEYVFSQEAGFTRISGQKTFTGNVSVNELILNGLLDDVDLDEVILRSVPQYLPGNFSFSNLEISESLKIDGMILVGPNLEKFVPNPTLEEANTLDSHIDFSHLEIEGKIIVDNKIDEKTVKDIFEDAVYKDEITAKLIGKKEFLGKITIKDNLQINSNTINDITIDNILTIDSEQVVKTNSLNGQYNVENLDLIGTFNNLQAAKLLNDIVRIDQDANLESELIFDNTLNLPDIYAKKLHIINKVNGKSSSEFIWTSGNRVFEEYTTFDSMTAENTKFIKDLNHEIDCFDINEFDVNRLSLTREQTITGQYTIENGKIDEIQVDSLNTHPWETLKDYVNITRKFYNKLLNSEYDIEELYVNGELIINKLNGIDLNKIFKNVIWTDREFQIKNNIIFENEVVFDSLNIDNFNNENFLDFISDIVLMNETEVMITGYKIFENSFAVQSLLETERINDIRIKDILTKSTDQNITGNVIVNGNVWLDEDLNVKQFVNNVSIRNLKHTFKIKGDSYIINGDINIPHKISINRLYLKTINGVTPQTHFNNIISVYDDRHLVNSTIEFQKKVHIRKNLAVAETIDGVDFDELMKDLVFVSLDDFVQGLVKFEEELIVNDSIIVENDLDTKYISGFDVNYWRENAAYLTESFLPGQLNFEKLYALSNIDVDLLNSIDMNSLIPLHLSQNIDTTLNTHFMTTDNDVDVGNLVNGFILEQEYLNTVTAESEQNIQTDTVFVGPITIKQNLNTIGLTDGVNLHKLVTLDTDQNLTASYVFSELVSMNSGLQMAGKLNDIDMKEWEMNSVTRTANEIQNITTSWIVQGNAVFQMDVGGNFDLDKIHIKTLAKDVSKKYQEKYEIEQVLENDYRNVCSIFQNQLTKAKSQTFLFKHFEIHQHLSFPNEIQSTLHFWNIDQYFLIINEKYSCISKLYLWTNSSFKKITEVKTGEVEQFITVHDSNHLYLVTKNLKSKSCQLVGTNLWHFSENTLVHVYGLDTSVSLHKSKAPGSFYALNNESVTEYKLSHKDEDTIVHAYTEWQIPHSNDEFHVYEDKSGLSLTNKENILKLSLNESEDSEPDFQTRKGDYTTESNHYFPSGTNGQVVAFQVGTTDYSVQLTAVIILEETTIIGNTDIKIYEDISQGIVFQKIQAFRPSNLLTIDFEGTDEILLIFLENYHTLQIYEYKGIQGFKHRTAGKLNATKLSKFSLPLSEFYSKRNFLLAESGNNITLIQAVMDGDRPVEDLYCD